MWFSSLTAKSLLIGIFTMAFCCCLIYSYLCNTSIFISSADLKSMIIKSISYFQSDRKSPLVITPPAVIAQIGAGIGNQLFMYACAYALSKDLKIPLYINYSRRLGAERQRVFGPRHREFALDQFNIPLENLIDSTTKVERSSIKFLTGQELLERSFLQEQEGEVRIYQRDYESSCQSLEYFRQYQDDIKTFFQPRVSVIKDKLPQLQPYIDKLLNTESVIVHVRQGDISHQSKWIHLTPISFHRRAIRKMIRILDEKRGIRKPVFFVFSDDISYAEKMLKDFERNFEFVYMSKELKLFNISSIIELHLMTLGKHIIFPPSTFSWWGAYLMKNTGKIVITSTFSKDFFQRYKSKGKLWTQFDTKLHGKLYHPKEWILINPFTGGLSL